MQVHGYYPINHLVVVRDELLQETPQLADALFKAATAGAGVDLGSTAAWMDAIAKAADVPAAMLDAAKRLDPLVLRWSK